MLDAAVAAQGAIRRKAAAAFGADVRKDKHVITRCGNGGCVRGGVAEVDAAHGG